MENFIDANNHIHETIMQTMITLWDEFDGDLDEFEKLCAPCPLFEQNFETFVETYI